MVEMEILPIYTDDEIIGKHVAAQPYLCLISDMHAPIESSYNNLKYGWHSPLSVHVYCIKHIAQSFMREIKDKNLKKKLLRWVSIYLFANILSYSVIYYNINPFF